MLLSRLDAASESLPSYLACIAFSLAVLSLSSIHDASAGGPARFPKVSIFDDVSFEKSLDEALPLRSRAIISLPASTDIPLTRPGETGASASKAAAPSLSFPTKDNPLPVFDTGLTAALSAAKTPQIALKPYRKLPRLKAALASGAIYHIGSQDRDTRIAMDLFLPTRLGSSSSLFLESRAEYRDPFAQLSKSADARFDLGFGIGWRHAWDSVMLGTNAFWDAARMDGDWYASPGFGVEFAWYSSIIAWDMILNSYRGGGIDLKSGFTFPVWKDRLDMRIYAEKYRFFDGEFILGSKAGVEISSPDRLVTLSYAYGQDSRDPEYHAVACSLAVPFRLENIFRGKNPFEAPDSPDRDLRYAEGLQSEGVKRAWRRPDTVVEARNTVQGERWTTPGKLADSLLWSRKPSKPEAKPNAVAKDDSRCCEKTRDCGSYSRCEKCGKDTSSGPSLLGWLLGTDLGQIVCLGAATYVGGDYTYRNAFGPFEIEPYEKERIKQEMSKKQRKRK